MRTTLFRLLWPDTMKIDERGMSSNSARKSMQASFARPSTGGAVRAILRASPSSPTTAFLRARGWTRTEKVTPAGVSWRAITSYMISKVPVRACSSMVRAAHS
jgi:hypothetical protein